VTLSKGSKHWLSDDEAEEQLRQLLTIRYDLEDFNAFMTLQEAGTGQVKQESRERLRYIAVEQCS